MWLQLSSLQSSLCLFFFFSLLVTCIGNPYILWFIDKLKIISVDWIVYRRLNLFHKCEIRISTFIQLILCHFTQSVKSVIYYTGRSPDDFSVAYIFYSLQRDSFWTLVSKIMFCYRSVKNKESWLSFILYHLFVNHSACVCVCVSCLVVSLCNPMDYSPLGFSPGKSTGVDYHSLLQGIFPTQESNPDLLHCR